MEKRTQSPYPRLDRPVLAVIGVALVIATVLFARNDREHEWRWYQEEFRTVVAQKFGDEQAGQVPAGIQQIWVPALGRADRCVTCHMAVSYTGFETGASSRVFLFPATANAGAVVATTYVLAANITAGQFVITHASDADVDQTFYWVALG